VRYDAVAQARVSKISVKARKYINGRKSVLAARGFTIGNAASGLNSNEMKSAPAKFSCRAEVSSIAAKLIKQCLF